MEKHSTVMEQEVMGGGLIKNELPALLPYLRRLC